MLERRNEISGWSILCSYLQFKRLAPISFAPLLARFLLMLALTVTTTTVTFYTHVVQHIET